MALLQNVIASGTHAARPAAGSAGIVYYETDTFTLFRDNGASWDQIAWPRTPPLCQASQSGSQSCNSGTSTYIPLATTNVDQGTTTAQHSTSVNTSRLTCQYAGWYLVTAELAYASNNAGERDLFVQKNRTTTPLFSNVPFVSADSSYLSGSCVVQLAVNDYLEIMALQNCGSALNASSGVLTMSLLG